MVKLSNTYLNFSRDISQELGKSPEAIQRMIPGAWDTLQSIQYTLDEVRQTIEENLVNTSLQKLLDVAVPRNPDGNYSAEYDRVTKLYASLPEYYEDFNALMSVIGAVEMATDPRNLADSKAKSIKGDKARLNAGETELYDKLIKAGFSYELVKRANAVEQALEYLNKLQDVFDQAKNLIDSFEEDKGLSFSLVVAMQKAQGQSGSYLDAIADTVPVLRGEISYLIGEMELVKWIYENAPDDATASYQTVKANIDLSSEIDPWEFWMALHNVDLDRAADMRDRDDVVRELNSRGYTDMADFIEKKPRGWWGSVLTELKTQSASSDRDIYFQEEPPEDWYEKHGYSRPPWMR